MRLRLPAWILLGLLAWLAPVADSEPVLTDLHSLDQLRALFNRDQGHPRLILLFSPT